MTDVAEMNSAHTDQIAPSRTRNGALRMRLRRAAIAGSLVLAGIAGANTAAAQKRGDLVERSGESDWTLRVHVNIRPGTSEDRQTRMPQRQALKIESAAIVFPEVRETANHFTWPGATGELKIQNQVVDDKATAMSGNYHSGVRLNRWDLTNWDGWVRGESITLSLEIPVTCFNTRFDEATAMQLPWPEAWPAEAQSTFGAQMFINHGPDGPYDMAPVKDLVMQWTRGQDPKNVKPVELAKFFAGEVWRHVQPSGNGLTFSRQGEMEGVDLQGAPETAKRGQGTEFDMVCLLAAVYREAGLPARTVIGFDVGAKGRNTNPVLGSTGSAALRAWVEFAVVDRDGTLFWVPVDIVRMRKSSSRPPNNLHSTWRWFGTHNELDGVIPFAFHFHPPTTVVSHGSPAFWGWMVNPQPPTNVQQAVRFDAIRTPRRPSRDRPTGPQRD